jgi:hypothetical protein
VDVGDLEWDDDIAGFDGTSIPAEIAAKLGIRVRR